MRKKITNNLPLKLMSVIVAVFVWLIVVNVDNPTSTVSFEVPVTVSNSSYVEKDGKMYLFDEGQETTRVSVTGRRKTVERLKASDITATADLRQAVSLNTDPVMVPISLSCRGIDSDNLSAWPQNIAIKLEETQTQEYIVSVVTGESKPGRGYEIGIKSSNPEKVRITGPKSLIQKIDQVVASVDVNGRVQDVTEMADLKIIDRNQEELSESQMKYLKYDLANPQVSATVDLWRVKKVSIKAEYSGYPAEGYKVGSLTLTPTTVNVTGSEEALALLEEQGNTIWIPAEQIDVSGEDRDCERQVDLTQFLPTSENLRLAENTSNKVIVKASILPVGSEAYMFPTKDIKALNVANKLDATFETSMVEIRVYGEEEMLAELSADDIRVSADLSDMKEGTYEVPLKVVLPKGYELVSEVSTEIKLSQIEELEESEE